MVHFPATLLAGFSAVHCRFVQHRRGVEVEHFLPALSAGVPAPRIGQQGDDRVVQVGRLALGVASAAYRAEWGAGKYGLAGPGAVAVEVGEVVQAPFGAEHQQHFAAHVQFTAKYHDAVAGGEHRGALAGEDVDALVRAGAPPGFVPEALRMPVPAAGVLHGHAKPLRCE